MGHSSSIEAGIILGITDVEIVILISELRNGSTNALSIRESRINATLFLSLRMTFSLASIFSASLTSSCRSALPSKSRTMFVSLARSKLESAGYEVLINPMTFISKNFDAF